MKQMEIDTTCEGLRALLLHRFRGKRPRVGDKMMQAHLSSSCDQSVSFAICISGSIDRLEGLVLKHCQTGSSF